VYIQITTRCNMECPHCCYACTAKGEDMSLKTFKQALELVEDSGSTVCIGGGEPTLHPKFWDFIVLALGNEYIECVWMATNGKKTESALRLAAMAKKGILSVALSQDSYHEPIEEKVIEAFKVDPRRQHDRDFREIRNVDDHVIKAGRAETEQEWQRENDCVCNELFVDPKGNIWRCGCKEELLGHVSTGYDMNSDYRSCSKEEKEEDE